MSADKRVDELEPGDVVLNIFDVEHVVRFNELTGYKRASKHTGQEVDVHSIVLTNGDSYWWNADRKVRVRS